MKKKSATAAYKSFAQLQEAYKKAWGEEQSPGRKDAAQQKNQCAPAAPRRQYDFAEMLAEHRVENDSHLFSKAVAGVMPLTEQPSSQPVPVAPESSSPAPPVTGKKNENTGENRPRKLVNLERLVREGIGSEAGVLNGGGSVAVAASFQQDYGTVLPTLKVLDLHGQTVAEARILFDNFLEEAIRFGLPSVLIIHGRGLSSPGEPILKKKVKEWLTSGMWRNRGLDFRGARPEDGGTGATYICLPDND